MKAGEDKLIERIVKALAPRGGPQLALGAGDDAALLTPRRGFETILTCDWFLEGTHFLRGKHPPDSVGWKCLARAVSDIAAMGGQPKCFLLSLALPQDHTLRWLDQFLGGLRHAARRFGCELAGGDTTRRRVILIGVTVVGEVLAGQATRRSGAKAGDLIFVTGRLGEAQLGLRSLRSGRTRSGRDNPSIKKHLYPEPRLALGYWLARKHIATSMMDISDGLSSDLSRLCAASGVGARIAVNKIPKVELPQEKARRHLNVTELALNGGDDYELLFTVRPSRARALPGAFQGIPLSCIGEIARERRLVLLGPKERETTLAVRGWDPFRQRRYSSP
jgi:thiamine-monophosphate kinase